MISHQMTLSELEILLNSSVEPQDVLRLSKQAMKIYELLQIGPVKTSDLALVSFQYNARVHEVRHALVKIGLMLDLKEGEGGQNQYEIVSIEQSSFWKKVRKRNEEWKWLDVGSAPIESD